MGKSEYHLYQMPMEETLKEIVNEYERVKESIDDINDFYITDFPASSEWIKFNKKYDEVQFDPYIPEKLKKPILEYLNKRAESAEMAHQHAVENFLKDANAESCTYVIKEDNYRIHNYYLQSLEEQGSSVENMELEANKIKENFQKYMEAFQP